MPNRFVRLPLPLDVERLGADAAACLGPAWTRHFNQRDYAGEWTAVALRSASGTAADIASVPGARYRDTPLLDACPYFTTILRELHVEKESVRLLRLAAGSTDRIHLIVDGLRNAWSDRVFAQAGYDFAEEARGRRTDASTRRAVIETLRARGTPTDLRVAADLEARDTDHAE